MSKQQKQVAIVAAGAIVLLLVWRWYQGQSGGSSSTAGTAAPDTSGSDFASLAGQEQSDVAGLQGQNQQLLSQEQSDVANLQGLISGLGAQEQSDVSGLTSQMGAAIGGGVNHNVDGAEIAALAAGIKKLNRAQNATISTHRGGAFYKYYVKVTGHAPPAHIKVTNAVWQAWKAGVKATALQPHPAHPSAPKNTHVAHPNPNHQAQTTHKPTGHPELTGNHWVATTTKVKAATKPTPTRPKPPKPKTKPKSSGRRR